MYKKQFKQLARVCQCLKPAATKEPYGIANFLEQLVDFCKSENALFSEDIFLQELGWDEEWYSNYYDRRD